jgi:NAD+ kinase
VSSSSTSSTVQTPHSRPTSIGGSTPPSPSAVRRAAVITHGNTERIAPALARLEALARDKGVELVFPEDEAAKHRRLESGAAPADADICVVLGGDGTILRGLQRFLGTSVPVIGVNFGRVGFLASIRPHELELGLSRVFAGEYRTWELPTLEGELNEERFRAVNDVVATSGTLGRMIELAWAIGDEDLGRVPCDGVVVSTPSGSTAYNLSNGGPVLGWGLDAAAVTFVAPHSLRLRPLVVPRGRDIVISNDTVDVPVTVIADGHAVGEAVPGDAIAIRLAEPRSLLATLPEVTFFGRYHEIFANA